MTEKIFFEEGNYKNVINSYIETEPNGIIGFLIKKGIAKNKKQSNIIILVLIILMTLISLWLVFGSNINNDKIITKDGKIYSLEEYKKLSIEGNDPLLNN